MRGSRFFSIVNTLTRAGNGLNSQLVFQKMRARKKDSLGRKESFACVVSSSFSIA